MFKKHFEPNDFIFEQYTPEEIKFFNKLADKYDLNQTVQHFVLQKNNKEIYIPKLKYVPTANGLVKVEEFIKQTIEEENEEEN